MQVVFENGGRLSYLNSQCRDSVYLEDGETLDAEMCDNDITSSPTYIATSGSLDLYFVTNHAYQYKGFSLTVTLIGKCWETENCHHIKFASTLHRYEFYSIAIDSDGHLSGFSCAYISEINNSKQTVFKSIMQDIIQRMRNTESIQSSPHLTVCIAVLSTSVPKVAVC